MDPKWVLYYTTVSFISEDCFIARKFDFQKQGETELDVLENRPLGGGKLRHFLNYRNTWGPGTH